MKTSTRLAAMILNKRGLEKIIDFCFKKESLFEIICSFYLSTLVDIFEEPYPWSTLSFGSKAIYNFVMALEIKFFADFIIKNILYLFFFYVLKNFEATNKNFEFRII